MGKAPPQGGEVPAAKQGESPEKGLPHSKTRRKKAFRMAKQLRNQILLLLGLGLAFFFIGQSEVGAEDQTQLLNAYRELLGYARNTAPQVGRLTTSITDTLTPAVEAAKKKFTEVLKKAAEDYATQKTKIPPEENPDVIEAKDTWTKARNALDGAERSREALRATIKNGSDRIRSSFPKSDQFFADYPEGGAERFFADVQDGEANLEALKGMGNNLAAEIAKMKNPWYKQLQGFFTSVGNTLTAPFIPIAQLAQAFGPIAQIAAPFLDNNGSKSPNNFDPTALGNAFEAKPLSVPDPQELDLNTNTDISAGLDQVSPAASTDSGLLGDAFNTNRSTAVVYNPAETTGNLTYIGGLTGCKKSLNEDPTYSLEIMEVNVREIETHESTKPKVKGIPMGEPKSGLSLIEKPFL